MIKHSKHKITNKHEICVNNLKIPPMKTTIKKPKRRQPVNSKYDDASSDKVRNIKFINYTHGTEDMGKTAFSF